jgi:hypothetical protein
VPCLLGCLALSAPRFVFLLVFLFTDYLPRAYETTIWPFLGFFFLPLTTLTYAAAMNENNRQLNGIWLALVIVAVAVDLGIIRFGSRRRRRETPPPSPPSGPGRSIDVARGTRGLGG